MAKARRVQIAAQVGQEIGFVIEHDHANAGGERGACHLRMGRPTRRLEDDGIGLRIGGLDS